MDLHLTSPAFTHEGLIPKLYSCKGSDYSPALHWDTPPPKTQSLVLIMDDPDAPMGTWDHWVLFNLPATLTHLDQAASTPKGALGGKNSWGHHNYGGPCPPSGTHRYFFKLYALDCQLTLTENATKQDVKTAMQGHILATGELMGKFQH